MDQSAGEQVHIISKYGYPIKCYDCAILLGATTFPYFPIPEPMWVTC